MTDPSPETEKTDVAAQLKQFAENVSRFAVHASEEQQRYLFRLLEDSQLVGLLEHWDRRKAPRKPCHLLVRYVVEDRILKDLIIDISTEGAFMQTCALLSVGQHITLIFSPPSDEEAPINVTGKIVRTTNEGAGIAFLTKSTGLEKMIESL